MKPPEPLAIRLQTPAIRLIMHQQALQAYFLFLAVLATTLLWGVSLWNGTVKALLLACWHGELDGIPLKTTYTGIAVIDFPLSVLIAFFFTGTNNSDRGYQYFLIDAYSTLQSAFVWLYVEASRTGATSMAIAK